MAKILILGESGIGKTTSMLPNPDIGITGLDPAKTYIISATSKPLPARGSNRMYPVTTPAALKDGRRIITKNGNVAASIIRALSQAPDEVVKNIVLDDFNYFMQWFYLENSAKSDNKFQVFSDIGTVMHDLFAAMELTATKNIYILAHPQTGDQGQIISKLKTVGKMVDEKITPEGFMDILLIATTWVNPENLQDIRRVFATNHIDGFLGKSPVGMFPSPYIPNDLGLVDAAIADYYG